MSRRDRVGVALAAAGLATLLAAHARHPLLAAVARPPWGWPAVHPGILVRRLAGSIALSLLAATVLTG